MNINKKNKQANDINLLIHDLSNSLQCLSGVLYQIIYKNREEDGTFFLDKGLLEKIYQYENKIFNRLKIAKRTFHKTEGLQFLEFNSSSIEIINKEIKKIEEIYEIKVELNSFDLLKDVTVNFSLEDLQIVLYNLIENSKNALSNKFSIDILTTNNTIAFIFEDNGFESEKYKTYEIGFENRFVEGNYQEKGSTLIKKIVHFYNGIISWKSIENGVRCEMILQRIQR